MEYAILDELVEKSEQNRELYQTEKNVYIKSGLEELTEPWAGSDDIKAYIYHNYCRLNGPIDILILIRELDTNQKEAGGFQLKKVEQTIYPLYATTSEDAIDIPSEIPAPEFHPDIVKFILDKRTLPKKKYAEEFDPTKHKWDINRIASTLNISNRLVARYCRAKHI